MLETCNHLQLSSKSWALESEISLSRRLYHQSELSISIAKSYLVLQDQLLHVKRQKKIYTVCFSHFQKGCFSLIQQLAQLQLNHNALPNASDARNN
jgi:hypothetical protein